MNYSQRHQQLLKQCILVAQKAYPTLRLFPVHVGNFYVKRGDKFIGPYKLGTKGQADLNGVIKIKNLGVRIEIEIKTGKTGVKKNSDQGAWRDFCKTSGIIYIEARSARQLLTELKKQIDNAKKSF